MMPDRKLVASVRDLRKRREAFKRLQASKGGPEAKSDTVSSSGQIQTPAAEPANLLLSHADYEIRTNDALGNIHCSENIQINTVAGSMAELELVNRSSSSDSSESMPELVKKSSSSSGSSESMAELELVKNSPSSESMAELEIVKNSSSSDSSESMAGLELVKNSSTSEEEEEESDSSSDSFDNASAFGEEELIAYAKIQDNRDPYADSDSDHSAEEEQRLLFERHQEEWIRSGKARQVENLLELRKSFLCNLCLAKGHSSVVCPYLDGIPKEVTRLPPGYSIMCKRCHKIVEQSCHHGDEARCAIKKHCVNCGQWGDHWPEVCLEEMPWWKLERQREKKHKKHKKNKA